MSFRRWISAISLLAVVLLVIFAWEDIVKAWRLLGDVQPWVLALVIPTQILSYYASGAIIASFLKAKGELKGVTHTEIVRFSLEFNFVNHVLPSGGLAGLSYATWRFKHMGVSTARAALANMLRAMLVFVAFLVLLVIAVLLLALDGQANRLLLVFAATLSTLITVGTALFVYVVMSSARSKAAGRQLAGLANRIMYRIVRRKSLVKTEKLEDFFVEMHNDYIVLHRSPRQLKVPLIWAFVFLLFELLLFVVVFASFGEFVNPAALLVAYGFACFAGVFAATPGGAGAFEAVMVTFLVGAGVDHGVAIAGVLLARVILILLTIASGYIFYQLTLLKHGRTAPPPTAV